MTIDGFDGGGTREGCLPLANLQLSAFQAQQHASPTNWVGATGHKPQLGSLLRPEPTIAPEFDQESPCPPVKAKPHPYGSAPQLWQHTYSSAMHDDQHQFD